MFISKRSHKVIAVVIAGLHAELDSFIIASALGCLNKVLG